MATRHWVSYEIRGKTSLMFYLLIINILTIIQFKGSLIICFTPETKIVKEGKPLLLSCMNAGYETKITSEAKISAPLCMLNLQACEDMAYT